MVEEFAKKEYESYILIDFAFAGKDVMELFDDISDLNYIFLQLQLKYRKDLKERKSLIIFDEVQFCPKARQAIKFLVKDILIPSEERRIGMYPMDYEEFLWAVGDEHTFPLLRKCFEIGKGLGEAEKRRQIRMFRLYMLVGGMPQAVQEYVNTNNFKYVDETKRDICMRMW